MTRKKLSVLQEAEILVNGDRAKSYGDVATSNSRIANLWNAHLRNRVLLPAGARLTTEDVSIMMMLLKVAREEHQHKRDNLVDIAGWLLTAANIAGE